MSDIMGDYIALEIGREIIEAVIGIDYDEFTDNEEEIIQQLEAEELFNGE